MISKKLRENAIKIWSDYGEAIKKAFNFTGFIEAGPVLNILQTEDEEKVRKFINYIKTETKEISEAKLIGEE